MKSGIQQCYEWHHKENRGDDFSILENDRGALLKKEIGTDKDVLDIGCRDGALTKHFTEGNRVLGVDIDERALSRAKEKLGIETKHMDLNGDWGDLGDRTFDVIVAGEVVEHLYYPDKVVERVKKHLRPDGIFIGSVPNAFNSKNRIRLFLGRKKNTPLADPTHINHFTQGELQSLLKRHFTQVTLVPLGTYAWIDKLLPGLASFSIAFIARV